MQPCRTCGALVDWTVEVCPSCGVPVRAPQAGPMVDRVPTFQQPDPDLHASGPAPAPQFDGPPPSAPGRAARPAPAGPALPESVRRQPPMAGDAGYLGHVPILEGVPAPTAPHAPQPGAPQPGVVGPDDPEPQWAPPPVAATRPGLVVALVAGAVLLVVVLAVALWWVLSQQAQAAAVPGVGA